MHRIGRTGRMGRSGVATTIVAAIDLQKLHEFERDLAKKFPRMSAQQAMAMATMAAPEPRAQVLQRPVAVEAPAADGARQAPPSPSQARRRGRRDRVAATLVTGRATFAHL